LKHIILLTLSNMAAGPHFFVRYFSLF